MSAATDLLAKLAPATQERVVREYRGELLTGQPAAGAHPGVADIKALAAHERSFGGILQAMARGKGQMPALARTLLSSILDPALVELSKQYPAPVHRALCAVQSVPNYLEQSFIGGFDALTVDPLNELSEFPVTNSDAISFELERGTVTQFGRVLRIPRRDVVNDGNGLFFKNAGAALLAAAYRREASGVYGLLESGATLRDGQPWFVDGTNWTTQQSRIGALEKGFEIFAAQQYANGEYADNTPAVLVIPADWVDTASNIVWDILMNLGKMTVIKTGRVTSGYLFANPAAHPAVVLAGLSQDVMPTIETNTKPDMSLDVGLELRISHSFGVVPVSRLGIVKMSVDWQPPAS